MANTGKIYVEVETVGIDEAKQKICVQYEDENHNIIGEDKIFYEQVGKNFKVPLEKHFEDINGCSWKYQECSRPSFIISEDEGLNKVTVSYIPDYVDVEITYQDLVG